MNADTIKGKWQQIKGDLQRTWGKITDDEWEQTKGDANSVTGLIQNKYGHAKDDISTKVSDLFDKHTNENYRDPNRLDALKKKASSTRHPSEF